MYCSVIKVNKIMSFPEKLIKQKIMLNEIIHPEKANINFFTSKARSLFKNIKSGKGIF